MIGFIYLIRNSSNGKGYVGQTTQTVQTRFNNHKAASALGSESALHNAMRKYGIQNFSIDQVATGESGKALDELERHYIKLLETHAVRGHGYNLRSGGGGGGSKGRVLKEETRLKMAERMKNIWADENLREARCKALKARKAGKPNPNLRRGSVKGFKWSKPMSEKQRQEASERMKKIWLTRKQNSAIIQP